METEEEGGIGKIGKLVKIISHFSVDRLRTRKALETKIDDGIIAVKIIQVSEKESTTEVLVDTPKKYKKRKMVNASTPYARKATAEEMGSNITLNISEKEKKKTKRSLPTLYDYRTLSSMHRCFQLWRPLEVLDESDGDAFGKMLMENTSGLFDVKARSEIGWKEKLEWFFREFVSMKELKE